MFDAFHQSSFEPNRKRLRMGHYSCKAEELSKELGYGHFQCSSGCLQRFKGRHAIVQKKICGESVSVSTEHVTSG
jgi:hypothetical protein